MLDAGRKTSKWIAELNACSLHISNKGIHEGVNLHSTVLLFFHHWITFISLDSFSHLQSVNGLSQMGVKVSAKKPEYLYYS